MINSAQSPDDLEAAEAKKQIDVFLNDILGDPIEAGKKELIEKQTSCFSIVLGFMVVIAIVLIVVVIVFAV
jgi:hypothetical protein